MKLVTQSFLLALLAVFSFHSMAVAQDELPPAEEVLQKYCDATGGADAYKAIQSMKMSGIVSLAAQGINGKIEVISKGNMGVTAIELDGIGVEKQGTDGTNAWAMSGMTGNRLLTGAEAEAYQLQNDFRRVYEPLAVYESAETVGMEDVDDKPCYKVKITLKTGSEQIEFYDVETGLATQSIQTADTPMGQISVTVTQTDYREVNGIKMPHKIKQDLGMAVMEMEIQSVEINSDIADSEFALPEAIQTLVSEQEASDREEAGSATEEAGSASEEAGSAAGGSGTTEPVPAAAGSGGGR